MFTVKRVPPGEPTRISIEMPQGAVVLHGDAEFCMSIWADVCKNEQFAKALKEGLIGETMESIAEKLKEAGFEKETVEKFLTAICASSMSITALRPGSTSAGSIFHSRKQLMRGGRQLMQSKQQLPEDGSLDAGLLYLSLVTPRGEVRTQDEIAEACGVSQMTIHKLEKSAMEKLRRHFKNTYDRRDLI